MRVLVLSPNPELVLSGLHGAGDEMFTTMQPPILWPPADWVVSFGYRYLIGLPTLEERGHKVLNIHISMLPCNRGADPNFWSWFDDTPKGVSIHQVTRGLDTGPLYGQADMQFRDGHTLRSSYDALTRAASLLFAALWPDIRDGKLEPRQQPEGGSYHKLADKTPFFDKLSSGWDSPVAEVMKMGEKYRDAKRRVPEG